MPEMESPEMSLNIEIPEDSSFDDTVEIADTVLDRIAAIEDVETVGAFQDSSMMSGMSMGSSNQNSMSIYLILDENKKTSNEEIGQEIERSIEDLDLEVSINTSNMDMTAVGGSGIEVLVKGKEIDNLRDIALDISKTIEDIEGTTEVSNGLEDNSSEIRITVDKEKAMEKGLTVAQIFGELNSILSQDDSVTTLTISNRDFPVIVVDEQNQSIRRDNIEDIIIKNQEDEEVKIGDIVDAREEEGLSSINRTSQERYIAVGAEIDAGHNIGLVSRELENQLKDYELPEGYSIVFEGENKLIQDSLRDLILMTLLAIVLIYLIMVAQFQSLLSPFIVMFTIPLAFTGGLLALWL